MFLKKKKSEYKTRQISGRDIPRIVTNFHDVIKSCHYRKSLCLLLCYLL